jgi:hypothetical protein
MVIGAAGGYWGSFHWPMQSCGGRALANSSRSSFFNPLREGRGPEFAARPPFGLQLPPKPFVGVELVNEALTDAEKLLSNSVSATWSPTRTPPSAVKQPSSGSWLCSSGELPGAAPLCRFSRGVWVWNAGSQCFKDSGKCGCQLFDGFRPSRLAEPSRFGGLPLPNG